MGLCKYFKYLKGIKKNGPNVDSLTERLGLWVDQNTECGNVDGQILNFWV